MKVLIINESCGTRSHGRICVELARQMELEGHICKIVHGRSKLISNDSRDLAVRVGNRTSVLLHALLTRAFDIHGFGSYVATKRFLHWAEEFGPDMIWLHNLHGYYLHVGLLFKWIKKHPNLIVKWTLHDCWSFTGHCAHYMAVGCEKWKTQCHHCPEKKQYPTSMLIDNSYWNYKRKKQLFTNVPNMSLITPSQWLADQVKQSYLKDYQVEVVHNKIDLSLYKTLGEPDKSSICEQIREKYGIPKGKQMILAVASKWTDRKGMNDFLVLDQKLDHEQQRLVMVGLEKEQLSKIPETVIGIERTDNRQELVALYNLADVYVNLTYEENYPTVNLEAEACGTDVITYDAGGCRETIHRADSLVVAVGDLNAVFGELARRLSDKK